VVRIVAVAGGALAVALLVAGPGRASLFQPDDPMIVTVGTNQLGEPFPPDEFRRRMGVLGNEADPRLTPDGGPNPDRAKVLARVKASPPAHTLPADAAAARAADMLRLGNTDAGFFVNDALDLLAPRTRDRSPSYFVHTTLAQLHAARGEWTEAATYHGAALIDCEMPAAVKGWTPEQRAWVARLDADVVPHYLRLRKADAEGRPVVETEDPTPLFPVRFVSDAGVYEPGTLAAAERAKLPADAVAVVQQLLLWFPSDTRLYWLLAELYAAEGDLDTAQKIFDECAWSRQFGNRKVFMDHRTAVTAAAEAKRRAADADAANAYPVNLRMILVYFGVVVVVGVLAVARALGKRGGGGCGTGGCG